MNIDKLFLEEIIIPLLISIITIVIEKYFVKKFFSQRVLEAVRKSRIIIFHFIISYIIWAVVSHKSITIFQTAIDIRIIIIVILNVLIIVTRIKDSQIDGSIKVKCELHHSGEIEIIKLKQTTDQEKLEMTWETLGSGIEKLRKYVMYTSHSSPDIIFGVNEVGTIMAAYLSVNLRREALIGVIKTGDNIDGKRPIIQFDWPRNEILQVDNSIQENHKIKNPKSILIVDNELKSGDSAKCIISMLRNKFGNDPKILYAVLCGVIRKKDKNKRIDDIEDFGWNIVEKAHKPNLMVFYIDSPGLRGPGGMR